jgi:predicted kinase
MSWKFPYYDVEKGIDWDSIEKNYDWFRDMKDVPQDKIWHAEGDVQIHTKMVCEAMVNLPEFQDIPEEDKHILFTACLMHDIEKRSVTAEEFKRGRLCIVAPKHAKRGEYTARKVLYMDIPTPYEVREQICKYVRYHGIPLWAVTDDDSEHRVSLTSLYVKNRYLGMIAKADILGRTAEDNPEQLEKIEMFNMLCEDLGCLDDKRKFASALHRYKFFSEKTHYTYEPYDESKFRVIMMCGIAGAGKDATIKEHYPMWPMVSIDDVRREMGIKPTDKKGNGRAIQETKERCKQHMRAREIFVFNATNITRDMRSKWVKLFEEYGGLVEAVYVEQPYKELIAKNATREYPVPNDVIDKMIGKLEMPDYDEVLHVLDIINE